jgi:hypothetical protein
MPIRPELRDLYPIDWPAISRRVRFDRADGHCEACGRPHGRFIAQAADGRWRELGAAGGWRDDRGEPIEGPPLRRGDRLRMIRVVLTCAHRNHWPPDIADANLAAWCGRCHLANDRAHHAETYRMRLAIGDLFLGRYPAGDLERHLASRRV